MGYLYDRADHLYVKAARELIEQAMTELPAFQNRWSKDTRNNFSLVRVQYRNVEDFVAKTRAIIVANTSEPPYAVKPDTIGMPLVNHFFELPSYYAGLLRCLILWTGAKHRLNRCGHIDHENLVAGFGGAFLWAHLGMEQGAQHAEYIKSHLNCGGVSRVRAADHLLRAMDDAAEAVEYLRKLTRM
jgi:antirestriction protein ArdC